MPFLLVRLPAPGASAGPTGTVSKPSLTVRFEGIDGTCLTSPTRSYRLNACSAVRFGAASCAAGAKVIPICELIVIVAGTVAIPTEPLPALTAANKPNASSTTATALVMTMFLRCHARTVVSAHALRTGRTRQASLTVASPCPLRARSEGKLKELDVTHEQGVRGSAPASAVFYQHA